MKISIFYTTYCNAKCEHCFIGKELNKHLMPTDLLVKVINEINNLSCVDKIVFTGGESLLYWNRIKEILLKFNKKKVYFATNAFWATSQETSFEFCKELKEYGIEGLEISTDYYHQKFISINNIKNAIEALKKLNLEYKVITCTDFSEKCNNVCREVLAIVKEPRNIIFQHTGNYGEIKHSNLICESYFFENKLCNQIMNPCITYDGNIYACCGPYIMNGNMSSFYHGNIYDMNLEQAINNIREKSIYNQIRQKGPLSILKQTKKELVKKNYSSLCEICIEIIGRK